MLDCFKKERQSLKPVSYLALCQYGAGFFVHCARFVLMCKIMLDKGYWFQGETERLEMVQFSC